MSIDKERRPGGGVAEDPRLTALEALRHIERRAALARLSYYIAHELGTPINVIHARAEMIASGEVTGEAILRSAQIMANQAARITTILRDVLTATRGVSLQRVPVNLLEIAEMGRSLVSLSNKVSSVHVEINPASEAVVVQGDPDLLLELVVQLVANGVQAMPEGGNVLLTVHAARRSRVDDPTGPPIDLGAITVRDEGGGVPKDIIEQTWKPFFTTHPRSPGDGAGLGLCIAQNIARDHGGFIEIESAPERGSCFTVFLPQGDT